MDSGTVNRRSTTAVGGWALGAVLLLAVCIAVSAPGCRARAKRRAAAAQKATTTRLPAAGGGTGTAPFDPVKVSALRERAIEELSLLAVDPTPVWRLNAIEAMVDAPGRLAPAVERGLGDTNEAVRAGAAMIAGRAGVAGVTAALRPMTRDPSPYVRASAIYALAKLGAAPDPTPLATMLMTDPSIRVRSHVVVILGELGDTSALPMIRQAAARRVKATPVELKIFQVQASEAMYKLGDEGQVETIMAALLPATPEELEVTALAVQILGELGYRPAVADLNNLAGDVDPAGRKMPAEVRLAAAAALAKLGRPRGVALVADEFATDPNPALRAQAAYAYGVIGNPQDLARLEVMLADQSGFVRAYAASAILRLSNGAMATSR